MFSKEYFLYLLKSKKYLLILIAMITLLNVLGNQMDGIMVLLQTFFSIVLSFAVPLDVFYHVHSKKAADTYFSLPVSRKALLWTGILFSFLVIAFPVSLGIIRFGYGNADFNTWLILAEVLLTCLTVTVFNTTLYLIGNNLVDGFVMMGAYTCMPLAILWIVNSFIYSYVAGLRNVEFFQIRFLSPLYLGIYLVDTSSYASGNTTDIPSIIGMCVILGIFAFLLHKSYVERAAERADSQSTSFLSYPFVIYFYVIICLFLIASIYSPQYENILLFIKDYLFLYVLLFAVFVAAHFLYRRKFYFSYKLPVFYVIAMIVSLLCASTCLKYKAFGLSDHYAKAQGKDYVSINKWAEDENHDEIYQFVKEASGSDPEYVQTYIEIGSDYQPQYFTPEMSEQTSDIIEEYRRMAIAYFYERRNADTDKGVLTIRSREDDSYYQYYIADVPDLETLKKLAEDPAVRIIFSTTEREYRLKADGTLMLTSVY